MYARLACSARRRRSSAGSVPSGSTSRSKRCRNFSRAGRVRALLRDYGLRTVPRPRSSEPFTPWQRLATGTGAPSHARSPTTLTPWCWRTFSAPTRTPTASCTPTPNWPRPSPCSRAQQNAAWDRTQAGNKLTSHLREYFPGYLTAVNHRREGIFHPIARVLLAAAPTPQQAAITPSTQRPSDSAPLSAHRRCASFRWSKRPWAGLEFSLPEGVIHGDANGAQQSAAGGVLYACRPTTALALLRGIIEASRSGGAHDHAQGEHIRPEGHRGGATLACRVRATRR